MVPYKETGDVQEDIAQLAQGPGLEWMAEIADRYDLDWQVVQEGTPYADTLEGGAFYHDRRPINRVTIGEGEIIIRVAFRPVFLQGSKRRPQRETRSLFACPKAEGMRTKANHTHRKRE